MSIRSTLSLYSTLFTRPMPFPLAPPFPVPRPITAASARLGIHHHPNDAIVRFQSNNNKEEHPDPKAEEKDRQISPHQPLAPATATAILSPKPPLTDQETPARGHEEEEEEGKEEEKEKKDRWYKKMFRSIAWGPTIVLNALLSLFWW